MRAREVGEPVDALGEGGSIADVETARIERVTSEKHAGAAIVDRDARHLVTGDGDHVQHASAKIDGPEVRRPVSDAEKRPDRGGVAANDSRGWPPYQLTITRNVVTVRVTVGNDEVNRIGGSAVPRQPRPNERVDRRRHVHPLGAGVEQQYPVAAEHEVQERLLEVGARRLAQDEKVRVIGMDLKGRRPGAVRPAGIEGCWKASRFDGRW